MLYYSATDVLDSTDINKSSKSKNCVVCHYWHFKDVGYKLSRIFVMDVIIY